MCKRKEFGKKSRKFLATKGPCRTSPRKRSRFDGGRLSSALTGTKFGLFSAISSHLSLQESSRQAKNWWVAVAPQAGSVYIVRTQIGYTKTFRPCRITHSNEMQRLLVSPLKWRSSKPLPSLSIASELSRKFTRS